jgi:excinuclease ABC subunit C
LTKNLDEDRETLLLFAIENLRERFNSITAELILPIPLVIPNGENLVVTVPKIGDKKKLLDLSEKNVQYHLMQRKRQAANQTGRQTSAERILRTLQTDLQMEAVPLHIECFDNSNIQGTNPVSSCVVFRNAKPSKKDYRHYNVKTVEGPNDFASMEEVVFRRYKRLLAEGESLPQLIIIDGGKGQLSAAMKSLRILGIDQQVTVVGIAKRLEEIFFPEDPVPLYINKKSESLKLMQQARNEAHRFAITFHRNQRSKDFIKTELTEIPGIGTKTAEKLLQHFGSIARVRETDPAELETLIGKVAAKKVRGYFEGEGEIE